MRPDPPVRRFPRWVLVASVLLAGAAIALAVVGEWNIRDGNTMIAQSDATVNAWLNSCAEGHANCTAPAPGIDQPLGRAGEQKVSYGTGLAEWALLPAGFSIALGVGAWAIYRPTRNPQPPTPPLPPE